MGKHKQFTEKNTNGLKIFRKVINFKEKTKQKLQDTD